MVENEIALISAISFFVDHLYLGLVFTTKCTALWLITKPAANEVQRTDSSKSATEMRTICPACGVDFWMHSVQVDFLSYITIED